MGSASSDSNNIVINAVRSNNKTLLQDILSKDDGKAVMNELDSNGTGVIHMIAKDGHYKYPPNDIPKLLIDSGLDVNKVDAKGNTALQISLLSGWQKVRSFYLFSSLFLLLF